MGCCLGTTKTRNPPPSRHHPNGPNNRHFHARSSVPEPYPTQIQKNQVNASTTTPLPPPPPVVEVEEESVKEVLSETPISKPQIPKIAQEEDTSLPPKPQTEPSEEKELPGEPSQASASCGISESYSYSTTTTTTTIADSRDEDEATSKRRRELGRRANGSSSTSLRRKHPYSGELSGRRERGAKPLPRASEQSFGKRNPTETRSFRGRESGQLRNMQGGGTPTGVRRDTLSSRSRSPATRNVGGVGRGAVRRSPAKVTGRAGGSSSQLGVDSQPANIKKEEEANDSVSKQGDSVSKQGNESIDNPLVSLECFIFV